MKYMLIMRGNDDAMANYENVTFETMLDAMGRFNDELISAGVLIACEGLDPEEPGLVVDYSADPPLVTDGPYGETKELFGGYYILDVASKEEAVEWAKRAPFEALARIYPGEYGATGEIEIRRVFEMEDLDASNSGG